jgi:two-component SAPR family response regulator/Flp pilus assembly protein TadD
MMRGAIPQSLDLLNQAVTGLRDTNLIQDLVASLIRRSIVNRYLGKYSLAMEDANEALLICTHHPKEKRLRAEALRVKGVNLYQQGELRNSLALLKESLEKYQGMKENLDASKVMLDLGVVHRAMGNLVETEACYKKSLEFWQKTQNSLWQSNVLNNLGVLQHMRGFFEMAMQNLERAVNYARLAANPRLECYSLTSLGDLYRDIHAFEEAHKVYALARSVLPGLNDLTLQILLNLSQCALERYEGNFHNTHHYLNEAEKLAVSGGSKYEESLCMLEAGTLALHERKTQKSLEKLTQAYAFFQQEGYKAEQIRAGFYLQILNLMKSNSIAHVSQFHDWFETPSSDDDQVSLLRLGSENLGLLQNINQGTPANVDLANFVERIRKYDHSLIDIRKLIRRHSSVIQFTTPRIAIRALGRTQVIIGDQMVKLAAWKTQSVRDLFFFVLQNSDGVTKEDIGEVFWPEADQQTIRLRFKNSIYRVRHALGTESVTLADEVYRFNRTLDYDYDVEDFLQEISSAQSTDDQSVKIQHLKNALALYKGPYLPKMDYEWALVQRENLHQKYLAIASNLIDLLIETKQYQQAIAYSDRAIEIDPCLEAAHRSAMVAYSALGDKAGMVRQFDKCKKLLLNDLGVTPSPQTETLYRTLIN